MQSASNPHLRVLYPLVTWRENYKIRQARGQGNPEARTLDILPNIELVVDGFPGSANSFFVRALLYAQARPIRLAHHLHAATAVRKAARLGIPTLVTLREPAGAALSLCKRWPYVSVVQALRHHVLYYGTLEPVTDAFVLSPFAATTRRPDLVIAAINDRFGTTFTPFPVTQAAFEAVRPMTPQKQARKAAHALVRARKRAELDRPEAQRWLRAAETTYQRLLSHAPAALAELEG